LVRWIILPLPGRFLPIFRSRPSPLHEEVSLKLLPQQGRLNSRIPFLIGAGSSGVQTRTLGLLHRCSPFEGYSAVGKPSHSVPITGIPVYPLFTVQHCNTPAFLAAGGKSIEEAVAGWYRVYDFFHRNYGEVESNALQLPPSVEKTEFLSRVRAALAMHARDEVVKLQMAPTPMPEGIAVFSSLFRDPKHGCYVFVFYQQP